ncbi:DUF6455 family protein [Marimonas arenosa]|uniref:DUF6455 family protein n=1 Tax=Marimonas arenosa TaxID=1795305 RepID=A0AAE3WCE1_9RHOB|nr:DUF6455 family protein [Marimonas arenosa]MDQ2090132.1 DUF6455 family protein [Marimonas arenosa]
MKDNDMPLGDPAVHFWLTRSVARAMGVNLSQAMATGRISAQDYEEMVTACCGCMHVAGCQAWLATEAVVRSAPFEACAHRTVLERLQ